MDNELLESLNFPELTFREEDHTYRLNGLIIPSVTTVMKPLSATVYKDVDEATLATAANRGTSVHEAIENFCLFGIKDCDPQFQPYFDAFLAWYKEYRVEVLASEVAVYNRIYRYAGTIDLIVRINGEIWLIDLKTTAVLNHMLTSVQLAGYGAALASHGIKFDRRGILHLKKTGKFKFDESNKKDDEEAWTTFGALLTVRSHIERYKKG